MKRIAVFKLYGTEAGSSQEISLDEISLLASPAAIEELGDFFIEVSRRMKSEGVEHAHLQDYFDGFKYGDHADIILLNSDIVKYEG